MKSIVSYPERGIGGNNKYRGNCTPKLIEDLVAQFKVKNISDYMRGSNTTGSVAEKLNIQSNTYDLNMGFDLVNDDIKERNQFIFWHPPYWDIIKYSGVMYGKPLEQDLSRIESYQKFMELINHCLVKQFYSLEKGGRIAVLMGDIKKNGKLYSMILDIMKLGIVENIVIKEQHNCWSENVSYKGKFIPIVHEYLLILKKPSGYFIDVQYTKNATFDMRDSETITWKDLISTVLENLNKSASLSEIYEQVDGHVKTKSNTHWQEKIRQTLQLHPIFRNNERGVWQLA